MFKHILIFTKAQLSAFIGGLTDYLLMIFLTEFFRIHYTKSIFLAGFIGAFVNFYLNRAWSFRSSSIPYKNSAFQQFLRFVPLVINSVVLKASGTYFLTSFSGLDYKISRLAADCFVSLLNFAGQKYWVFRKAS